MKAPRNTAGEAHLVAAGWARTSSGAWLDPLTGAVYPLPEAEDLQATRELQPALEAAGFRLDTGEARGGLWVRVQLLRDSRPGPHEGAACLLRSALQRVARRGPSQAFLAQLLQVLTARGAGPSPHGRQLVVPPGALPPLLARLFTAHLPALLRLARATTPTTPNPGGPQP